MSLAAGLHAGSLEETRSCVAVPLGNNVLTTDMGHPLTRGITKFSDAPATCPLSEFCTKPKKFKTP
jgi:hypothetical protein